MPLSKVRFVAVSATIPNIADVAEWLMVPPLGIMVYGEEMRPVKLRTVVRGYASTKTDFLFERKLNDYLPNIIGEFSNMKPTLVFCRQVSASVSGLNFTSWSFKNCLRIPPKCCESHITSCIKIVQTEQSKMIISTNMTEDYRCHRLTKNAYLA